MTVRRGWILERLVHGPVSRAALKNMSLTATIAFGVFVSLDDTARGKTPVNDSSSEM
jgi:hypothetical protein